MPLRVWIALLISFLDSVAFFGELASKEYTKMFVSRKNLALIHLVPPEAPSRLYMLTPAIKKPFPLNNFCQPCNHPN
jgi:hypothetical protein